MPRKGRSDTGLKVTVSPFGPTTEGLQAIGKRVLTLENVRKYIGRSKARLLYVETLDDDGSKESLSRPNDFGQRYMTTQTTARSLSTAACAMCGPEASELVVR